MIIPMTDDERRLTEEYLYLVPEMVKKLTTRCAYVSYDEQQDLLQAGNLALCKAAMNYDNTRPFAVYARVAIRNAIYSYWRKLQKERKYTCSMYASSEFDMEPLLVDPKTELWQEQCMNQEPIYKHLQSLEAGNFQTLWCPNESCPGMAKQSPEILTAGYQIIYSFILKGERLC